MYHFILIDQEFIDPSFPETFKTFAQKQDGSWKIYGVEIPVIEAEQAIINIQDHMKEGTWYAHGYRDNELIVIFKDKVFRVTIDPKTWEEVIIYGGSLGIPRKQLDFLPRKVEQEQDYFNTSYEH